MRSSPNEDKPTKLPNGRYTNVDFSKATNYKLPVLKANYTRRDVLLFVHFPAHPRTNKLLTVLSKANAIGCTKDELHFLYELHPEFSAFPTCTSARVLSTSASKGRLLALNPPFS